VKNNGEKRRKPEKAVIINIGSDGGSVMKINNGGKWLSESVMKMAAAKIGGEKSLARKMKASSGSISARGGGGVIMVAYGVGGINSSVMAAALWRKAQYQRAAAAKKPANDIENGGKMKRHGAAAAKSSAAKMKNNQNRGIEHGAIM